MASTTPAAAAGEGGRPPRLMIREMVLENFKSYAGAQRVGPFHKVPTDSWAADSCAPLGGGTERGWWGEGKQGVAVATRPPAAVCYMAAAVPHRCCLLPAPPAQSVSSVVGPNGSGKSNVIDAMLFVFGKRAKQLRLNKVSELIHNSTHHRNLEQARVSVHFQEIVDVVRGRRRPAAPTRPGPSAAAAHCMQWGTAVGGQDRPTLPFTTLPAAPHPLLPCEVSRTTTPLRWCPAPSL